MKNKKGSEMGLTGLIAIGSLILAAIVVVGLASAANTHSDLASLFFGVDSSDVAGEQFVIGSEKDGDIAIGGCNKNGRCSNLITMDPIKAGDGEDQYYSFGVGNFDGDDKGIQEFVVHNFVSGSGEVAVVFYDRSGWKYSPIENLAEGGEPRGEIIAVGDFDGDGSDEFVVGTSSNAGGTGTCASKPKGCIFMGGCDIHLNCDRIDISGDETFGRDAIIGADSKRFGFGVGDFDGNGVEDLIWHNYVQGSPSKGDIAVLYWDYDTDIEVGTWEVVSGTESIVGAPRGQIIAVLDFDGDGMDEFVVGTDTNDKNYKNGINIGKCTSTFSSCSWKGVAAETINILNGGSGERKYAFGVGDFNGDGREDLVWQNSRDSNVAVISYQNNEWKTTKLALAEGVPSTRGGTIAVGDFNGDGRDEFVTGYKNYDTKHGIGMGMCYENKGDKPLNCQKIALDEDVRAFLDWELGIWVFGVGDVTGDGIEDVIWNHLTESEGDKKEEVGILHFENNEWKLIAVNNIVDGRPRGYTIAVGDFMNIFEKGEKKIYRCCRETKTSGDTAIVFDGTGTESNGCSEDHPDLAVSFFACKANIAGSECGDSIKCCEKYCSKKEYNTKEDMDTGSPVCVCIT